MILSIVTINYNNLQGLIKTMHSVERQTKVSPADFEYIVIDGLSTDGAAKVIRENRFVTKYLIEKDSGIAEAFNKGIKLSKGEYIFFLNSGDTFYDDSSLHTILKQLKGNNYDILVNKIALTDKNGKITTIAGRKIKLKRQKYRNYLPHQSMFIKRGLFEEFGMYDTDFKIAMDYEWSLRLLKSGRKLNLHFTDKVTGRMPTGGLSETNYKKTFLGYHRARMKNSIMSHIPSYAISLFFMFRRTIGNLNRKS